LIPSINKPDSRPPNSIVWLNHIAKSLMIRPTLNKLASVYYGWRMIAASCAIRVLGGGLHAYGFTVYFLPVTQELGLTRAATSLVFSLARAQGAIEGPLAGYAIDRYGPRPVVSVATLLAGIGYMLLAGVNSYTTLLIVYMGVISLSYQAGFMDATMTVANDWFIRKRALAMSIISGSIALGGTLVTPLLAFGVHTWGWRRTAFAAGLAFLLGGTPLARLLRRSPESMGLLPDGDPAHKPRDVSHSSVSGKDPVNKHEFSLAETLRTYQFWLLALATTLRVVCSSSILVHFIPILVWRGLTQQQAAFFLAFLALLGMPAHLFMGWLGDRIFKPRLMASCMVIASFSVLLIFNGTAEWQLWIALTLFPVVEALFPVTWATVGDFFGRNNFAKIRGSMSFLYMWGSVIGPVMTGTVYDRYQSYAPMMFVLMGVFLVSACFYGSLHTPARR
jgi:sugar phosphate permease